MGSADMISRRANIGLNTGSGDTTIEVTKSTQAVAGDLMLACICVANHLATVTPPAGWNQVASISDGGTGNSLVQAWRKICEAGEPASHTFNLSVVTEWAAAGLAYVDSAGLKVGAVRAITEALTPGPNFATQSIQSIQPSDIVVSVWGQDNTGALDGVWTAVAPAALGMSVNLWQTSQRLGLGVAEETRVAVGAGSHSVQQNSGGDPARGSAYNLFVLTTLASNQRRGRNIYSGPGGQVA